MRRNEKMLSLSRLTLRRLSEKQLRHVGGGDPGGGGGDTTVLDTTVAVQTEECSQDCTYPPRCPNFPTGQADARDVQALGADRKEAPGSMS
jgi:hypothetical protein